MIRQEAPDRITIEKSKNAQHSISRSREIDGNRKHLRRLLELQAQMALFHVRGFDRSSEEVAPLLRCGQRPRRQKESTLRESPRSSEGD